MRSVVFKGLGSISGAYIPSCFQDAADTEMHVSEVLIGSLMETMLFRLFIIVVITLNCITIGIQTNDLIAKVGAI